MMRGGRYSLAGSPMLNEPVLAESFPSWWGWVTTPLEWLPFIFGALVLIRLGRLYYRPKSRQFGAFDTALFFLFLLVLVRLF